MATTTYFANPDVVKIGASSGSTVDLKDQCKSVVYTRSRESLDASAFGSSSRSYVGGLFNNQVTATFLMSYEATETYATLNALVGTQVYFEVAPVAAAPSATAPVLKLDGAYFEAFDVVNAELGTLSEVQITLTGGTYSEQIAP
jgi:hypothetical protein